ncbi:HEAT repeat domain-containing protein [bacterium]|nr:HEAT repeat domain-containing protein [bacterium]
MTARTPALCLTAFLCLPALTATGGEPLNPAERRILESHLRALESNDPETAVHAAVCLVASGDLRGLPKLTEVMRAKKPPFRHTAVDVLADLDHPSVAMLLLDGLERESDTSVQREILGGLGKFNRMKDPKVVARLKTIAKMPHIDAGGAREVLEFLAKAGLLTPKELIESVEAAGASGRGETYVVCVALGAAAAGGQATMKALAKLCDSKTPHVADAALEVLRGAGQDKDDDALKAIAALAQSRKGEEREKMVTALWIAAGQRNLPPKEEARLLLSLGVEPLALQGAMTLVEHGDLSALSHVKAEAAKGAVGLQYTIAKTLAPAREKEARAFLTWLFETTESRLVLRTILWTLAPHAAEADVKPFLRQVRERHPDLVRHLDAAPNVVHERVRWRDIRRTDEPFSARDCYLPVWNPSSQMLASLLRDYTNKERWRKGLQKFDVPRGFHAKISAAFEAMARFEDKTVSAMAREVLERLRTPKGK